MRDCLEAGVDTIEHAATIEPDMIEHFINNPNSLRGYTAVIPTLLAGGALHEHTVEDTPANRVIMANSRHVSEGSNNAMKTAVKHGISVGIGTDSSVPYCTPYNTYMELVKMQQLTNLPALDVIDYATKGTAEILGIGDITGTLQVGKSADFIVLAKNPLDDLHNIKRPEQVVAMGKHYPMRTPRKQSGQRDMFRSRRRQCSFYGNTKHGRMRNGSAWGNTTRTKVLFSPRIPADPCTRTA